MSSLRLLYFAPRDVLIPRVDRHCIIRFCEAMAENGVDVELVTLQVKLTHPEPTSRTSLERVYGIRTPFRIRTLPSFAKQGQANRGLTIWRALAYGAFASRRLLFRRANFGEITVLYTKNYLVALVLLVVKLVSRAPSQLFFEIHLPPHSMRGTRLALMGRRWILSRVDRLIAISGVLARELQTEMRNSANRIVVAHQGIRQDRIVENIANKMAARGTTGLSQTNRLVVYTGKVTSTSKEIQFIMEAARILSTRKNELEFVFVGGRDDHVRYWRERSTLEGIKNVSFRGFVSPSDVVEFQHAADVLVSYYPLGSPLNAYRSPGKLFEYMAAAKPIVVADYASAHEILGSGGALLVEPGDPEALARSIERILDDESLGAKLGAEAVRRVTSFTWGRRAERIIAESRMIAGNALVT